MNKFIGISKVLIILCVHLFAFAQDEKVATVNDAVKQIQKYVNANGDRTIRDLRDEVNKIHKKTKVTYTNEEFIEVLKSNPEFRYYFYDIGFRKTKYVFSPSGVVDKMAFEKVLYKNDGWSLGGSSFVIQKEIGEDFYLKNKEKYPHILSGAKSTARGDTAWNIVAHSMLTMPLTVLAPMFISDTVHGSIVPIIPQIGLFISFAVVPLLRIKKIKKVYRYWLERHFSTRLFNGYWYDSEAKIPWFTEASNKLTKKNNFIARSRWYENRFFVSLMSGDLSLDISFYKDRFAIRMGAINRNATFNSLKKSVGSLASAISEAISIDCSSKYL